MLHVLFSNPQSKTEFFKGFVLKRVGRWKLLSKKKRESGHGQNNNAKFAGKTCTILYYVSSDVITVNPTFKQLRRR